MNKTETYDSGIIALFQEPDFHIDVQFFCNILSFAYVLGLASSEVVLECHSLLGAQCSLGSIWQSFSYSRPECSECTVQLKTHNIWQCWHHI